MPLSRAGSKSSVGSGQFTPYSARQAPARRITKQDTRQDRTNDRVGGNAKDGIALGSCGPRAAGCPGPGPIGQRLSPARGNSIAFTKPRPGAGRQRQPRGSLNLHPADADTDAGSGFSAIANAGANAGADPLARCARIRCARIRAASNGDAGIPRRASQSIGASHRVTAPRQRAVRPRNAGWPRSAGWPESSCPDAACVDAPASAARTRRVASRAGRPDHRSWATGLVALGRRGRRRPGARRAGVVRPSAAGGPDRGRLPAADGNAAHAGSRRPPRPPTCAPTRIRAGASSRRNAAHARRRRD